MPTEPTSAVRAIPQPANFSLAANYDPELVTALAAYPVDEVYGKFPTDGISGGRPRYMATPLFEADLRYYISLLDRHGIAFNYLLNGVLFRQPRMDTPLAETGEGLADQTGRLGCATGHRIHPFSSGTGQTLFPRIQGKSWDLCPGGHAPARPLLGRARG